MGDDVMDVEVVASATAAAALKRPEDEEAAAASAAAAAAAAAATTTMEVDGRLPGEGRQPGEAMPSAERGWQVGSDDRARSIHERARRMVALFLREHRTEELIPENSRVVLLNSEVSLKAAFRALAENGIGGAPIWDSGAQHYLGMLTATDLIEVMQCIYSNGGDQAVTSELIMASLRRWKEISKSQHNSLAVADAEGSLFDACCSLRDNQIRRLPILCFKSNMVLHVMTHSSVLRFVHNHVRQNGYSSKPRDMSDNVALVAPRSDDILAALFDMTLGQLEIGTFRGIETTTYDTRIVDVLQALASRRISALPVVSKEGVVLDVYSRSDLPHLSQSLRSLSLDITVHEALNHHHLIGAKVETCRRIDTLRQIFEKFDSTGKHRLYCVNDSGVLEGVVTLSDVMGYFLSD